MHILDVGINEYICMCVYISYIYIYISWIQYYIKTPINSVYNVFINLGPSEKISYYKMHSMS